MASITPKQRPSAEAVTYTGKNTKAVVDLARRVLGDQVATVEVRTTEPHLGVNVLDAEGAVLARVEEGNTLVYDPMRYEVPLFVLGPDEYLALYDEG